MGDPIFKQINELHHSGSDDQDASKFTLKQGGTFLGTITNQPDKPRRSCGNLSTSLNSRT